MYTNDHYPLKNLKCLNTYIKSASLLKNKKQSSSSSNSYLIIHKNADKTAKKIHINSSNFHKSGRNNSYNTNRKIPESNSCSAFSKLNCSTSFSFSKIYFTNYRNYEEAKFSEKPNGKIIAYGANTNRGLFRSYNEDRVSIILNVIKPNSRINEIWPQVSYFAVYDGHGGNKCADFLKEHLHQYIFHQKCFPRDPISAIYLGFAEAEMKFVNNSKPANFLDDYDRSGACALVVIIMDDVCYVANLGDSRGLYSEGESQMVYQLSKDHKPSDPEERARIIHAGGQVYQGKVQGSPDSAGGNDMCGPLRLFPGRLSVSRSFGDLEAKVAELGGNPNVLLSTPSVISFKLKRSSDFIVLGSDGLFDKLSNREIIAAIWATRHKDIMASNIHEQSGIIVDIIMKLSLNQGTLDNITCIFICFENFYKCLFQKDINGNNIYTTNAIPSHVLTSLCTSLKEDEHISFKDVNCLQPESINKSDNGLKCFDKEENKGSSLRNIYSLTNHKKNVNYISLNLLSGTRSNLKANPKLSSYENYKQRFENMSQHISTTNKNKTYLIGKSSSNSFYYSSFNSKGKKLYQLELNQNHKHLK